jgi:hypothetical protein
MQRVRALDELREYRQRRDDRHAADHGGRDGAAPAA